MRMDPQQKERMDELAAQMSEKQKADVYKRQRLWRIRHEPEGRQGEESG